MTGAARLTRLRQVAQLSVDHALGHVARMAGALAALDDELDTLVQHQRDALRDANDPETTRQAIAYAAWGASRRLDLLERRSQLLLEKHKAVEKARHAIGRHSALQRLADQVS